MTYPLGVCLMVYDTDNLSGKLFMERHIQALAKKYSLLKQIEDLCDVLVAEENRPVA